MELRVTLYKDIKVIAQALIENSGNVLEILDFSDIRVGKYFAEMKINETLPNLKVITGGTWIPKPKKKPKMDPMTMLKTYMDQQGLRLVDFFNKLDTDGSMTLSRDEFKEGIQMAGIPMTESEIEVTQNVKFQKFLFQEHFTSYCVLIT